MFSPLNVEDGGKPGDYNLLEQVKSAVLDNTDERYNAGAVDTDVQDPSDLEDGQYNVEVQDENQVKYTPQLI